MANDLTTTAPGVAAENAPAPQVAGAGNPVGAPMVARTAARPNDPTRNYGKGTPAQAQGIETTPSTPGINTASIDPSVQAAMGGGKAAPPAPEQGQAPQPPQPPIQTGIDEAANLAAQNAQVKNAASIGNMDPVEASRLQRQARGNVIKNAMQGQNGDAFTPETAPTPEPVTAPVTIPPKEGINPRTQKLIGDMLKFADTHPGLEPIAAAIRAAPPDQQPALAQRIARLSRGLRGMRPMVNGKMAPTQAAATSRTNALNAIQQAVQAYPNDKPGVIPVGASDKQNLIGRLKNIVNAATAANGGSDPLQAYKPNEKSAERQLLSAAQRVIAKPTPANIKNYIANETLLQGGEAPADMAKLTQETDRIDADIAHKGEFPETGNELASPERPEYGPFDNSDQDESRVYEGQQNAMRQWLDNLSATDYARLATLHPDLPVDVETTQDPSVLHRELQEDLAGTPHDLVSPDETPGAPTEVFGGHSRKVLEPPVSPSEDIPAGEGRSLKGTPEFDALAAQYTTAAKAPEIGSNGWWKGKATDLLNDTSGVGLPLSKDNLLGLLRGSGPKSTDSAPLLKRIFSAASVSDTAKAAAALIRAKSGLRARDLAQIGYQLEPLRTVVNAQPEATRIAFMEAMDTGAAIPDPKLQPLADKLRAAFYTTRMQLEDLGAEGVEFLNDYFPHMFKDPIQGKNFMQDWWSHQGSGASLKHRAFPTIKAALASGYKLASTDPIEVSLRYLSSMRNYIEAQQIINAAKMQGYVKPFFDIARKGASGHPQGASDAPLGWAPLKGRAAAHSFYAPEDWARVYNNYISKGFSQNPETGQLYNGLQHASNAVTSLELGISAYHAFTMAKEAVISDVANGISQMASGNFKDGLTSMAKAARAPVDKYKLGKLIQGEYLSPGSNLDPRVQDIVETMARSGARLASRIYDPTYQYSAKGKFASLWDVKQQFNESASTIGDAFQNRGALGGIPAAASEVVKGIGRIMQTAASPIFEKYIPSLKAGAFYDTFSAWMDANPRSTPSDQVAMARKIGDSIDNRFGEMVQDNIFWNRTLKQSAMLGMRSYSWNLGTVREIGGGLTSLTNPAKWRSRLNLASNNYDPRAAYVVAMPMVVALTSAVYQYLKTGQPPGDASDLMAPQTGGTTAYGTPERAILPGYEKDVYGWFNNPSQEALDKISTAPRLLWETLTNQDYRGLPIANPNDPIYDRVEAYLKHVAGSLGPISIRQQFQQPRGGGISRVEQAAGIRPAPTWLEAPVAIHGIIQKHNQFEWNAKLRADRRQQARME